MHHYILGTAGHIDHGKSSLVRALTGTDPDRLPEEKKRGMTITLGFAHLSLSSPLGGPLEIGLVDVPGHSDFIRQMVAGAGAIHAALLVVAADDGWMPQSEEHLQILDYLGIRHGVVALTKADLSEDPGFAAECVREDLRNSPFENAPVIPVSSHTGAGLDELRAALSSLFASLPPPADIGKPRLFIDRAFSPKGIGTVVTGTLTGGPLSVGDEVVLNPGGIRTSIRSLQNHFRQVETALPGMRTAVQLTEIGLATKGKPGAARGLVLSTPPLEHTTRVIDISVSRSPRASPAPAHSRSLRNQQRVAVLHGTRVVRGRIRFAGGTAELAAGETAFARIRLEEELPAFNGDRLVLRDSGQHHTLAGAVVLDSSPTGQPLARQLETGFLKDHLKAFANSSPEPAIQALLRRDLILDTRHLLLHSPFNQTAVSRAAAALVAQNLATSGSDRLMDRAWWEHARKTAANAIDELHRKRPEEPGLGLSALRSAIGPDKIGNRRLFDELIEALAAEGFERSGPVIRRIGHEPRLPEAMRETANAMLTALVKGGVDPPLKRDLLNVPHGPKILRFLVRQELAVDLDERFAVSTETYGQIRDQVLDTIRTQGPARATDLRQALGISRKLLMPTLERMDALKLTRRDGDFRHLGTNAQPTQNSTTT